MAGGLEDPRAGGHFYSWQSALGLANTVACANMSNFQAIKPSDLRNICSSCFTIFHRRRQNKGGYLQRQMLMSQLAPAHVLAQGEVPWRSPCINAQPK